jgi:hypothetical protein
MTAGAAPAPDLLALGIRQPWAELILQGVKTVEVRSLSTNVRGTIYLYAGKRLAVDAAARGAIARHGLRVDALPLGRLVGTVEIVDCRRISGDDAEKACVPGELAAGQWGWLLAKPQRLPEPLTVRFLPYGVWFYPFRRRDEKRGRALRRRTL